MIVYNLVKVKDYVCNQQKGLVGCRLENVESYALIREWNIACYSPMIRPSRMGNQWRCLRTSWWTGFQGSLGVGVTVSDVSSIRPTFDTTATTSCSRLIFQA